MRALKFAGILFIFCSQLTVLGCSDDEEDTIVPKFKVTGTTPAAVRDTLFIDPTVSWITITLETNVGYVSQHPDWLKKAENPQTEETVLTVKYQVEPYATEGHRDGVIKLMTPDRTQVYSVTVRQSYQKSEKRELLFEDDFEGTAFDPEKWVYEPKASSAWNYYIVGDDEHVQVKDGNLWLRATWDATTKTPKTGAVSTHNKFSFAYGEVEVRAKFVRAGQGGWPAIWMMPQTPLISGWPDCGELDIMERLNNETIYYSTIHMNNSYRPNPYTITESFDPSVYNTYGMKKYPGRIEFYLNGKKTFTMEKPADATEAIKWPFETDFYLILNQACADQGASGMNFWPGLVTDPSALPYEMAVDWVKIYKLAE